MLAASDYFLGVLEIWVLSSLCYLCRFFIFSKIFFSVPLVDITRVNHVNLYFSCDI